jgi:hypothetical protein
MQHRKSCPNKSAEMNSPLLIKLSFSTSAANVSMSCSSRVELVAMAGHSTSFASMAILSVWTNWVLRGSAGSASLCDTSNNALWTCRAISESNVLSASYSVPYVRWFNRCHLPVLLSPCRYRRQVAAEGLPQIDGLVTTEPPLVPFS